MFGEGFLEEVTLESSLEGPGVVGQIKQGLGREHQPIKEAHGAQVWRNVTENED